MPSPLDESPVERLSLSLNINRRPQTIEAAADASLLDVLRDQLVLTGTKRACDRGSCGACTVLFNGQRINACLMLAACADDGEILTVEGLADDDGTPSPLQRAFAICDALQCGYCTPGQLVAATGLLAEGVAPTRSAIAEAMSGNLCRCGAYPQIVDAIHSVLAAEERA